MNETLLFNYSAWYDMGPQLIFIENSTRISHKICMIQCPHNKAQFEART